MTGAARAAEAPAGPAADSLDFDQTIARSLVHRRSVAEVFVCDSARTGPDEFAVAVQLPRVHRLWSDRAGARHDSLMAVEAGRQATIMLGHAYYGLAADLMMVARSCAMRVHDREAFRDDGREPLEGTFLMRRTDSVLRAGRPVSLTFAGDLFLAGTGAMTMSGTVIVTLPEDYRLLRAHSRARKQAAAAPARRRPAALPPAQVGRQLPRNVVIGPPADGDSAGPPGRYPIIIDPADAAFFDHQLDHVPGQLLLEAARQSAIVTAVRAGALPGPGCSVSGCQVALDDFIELDAAADCSAVLASGPAAAGGAVLVRVGILQFGQQLGEIEIELTAEPPHERAENEGR